MSTNPNINQPPPTPPGTPPARRAVIATMLAGVIVATGTGITGYLVGRNQTLETVETTEGTGVDFGVQRSEPIPSPKEDSGDQ